MLPPTAVVSTRSGWMFKRCASSLAGAEPAPESTFTTDTCWMRARQVGNVAQTDLCGTSHQLDRRDDPVAFVDLTGCDDHGVAFIGHRQPIVRGGASAGCHDRPCNAHRREKGADPSRRVQIRRRNCRLPSRGWAEWAGRARQQLGLVGASRTCRSRRESPSVSGTTTRIISIGRRRWGATSSG